MKMALVMSLFFCSFAQAYTFKFPYNNAFVSQKQVKADLEKQASKINQAFLNSRNMKMQITDVDNSWPSIISGEIVGINCTPSDTDYQKIDLNLITYPTGVDPETLVGVGFVLTGKRFLLFPKCVN